MIKEPKQDKTDRLQDVADIAPVAADYAADASKTKRQLAFESDVAKRQKAGLSLGDATECARRQQEQDDVIKATAKA